MGEGEGKSHGDGDGRRRGLVWSRSGKSSRVEGPTTRRPGHLPPPLLRGSYAPTQNRRTAEPQSHSHARHARWTEGGWRGGLGQARPGCVSCALT